jgi:heavy metal translocating P-type ATPase
MSSGKLQFEGKRSADSGDCLPCVTVQTDAPDMAGFGLRIGLSLAFAGQSMIFGLGYNNALKAGEAPAYGSTLYWVLHGGFILSSLIVVMLLGRPLFMQAVRSIKSRQITVEALFVLSGCGAFVGSLISTFRGTGSVYYEVVAIVLCVYAIGKQIGVVQKGRVGQAVSVFRNAFDRAVVSGKDGSRTVKKVVDLDPSDQVLIQPGDPIPVDGTILKGSGYIRETALTGEPAPVSKGEGERVLAGTWSIDGNLVVQRDLSGARTIDKILGLLEAAPAKVSNLQRSADQLMQVFVPVVSLVSGATLLGWILFSTQSGWDALFNSMAVLLVACPCALGLAMPAGIWAGLYYLSQRGIVGRSGHLLDCLADCQTIVFDKTGTLTEFDLGANTDYLLPQDAQRESVLSAIARIGAESQHPVSEALSRLADARGDVTDLHVYPGKGLRANVDGRVFLIGEDRLLDEAGIPVEGLPDVSGKPVHVAVDQEYAGPLFLSERLRPDAEAAIEALVKLGCQCRILSGDPNPVLGRIAGIPVEANLSPLDKSRIIKEIRKEGDRILFIGDGVNDLPAMEASHAALAIDLGAALATEFADGLLVRGRVGVLPGAVRHARRLEKGLKGNMRFAIGYNLLGMGLAAAGILHPVVAALIMVGSSVIVSFRALRVAGLRG